MIEIIEVLKDAASAAIYGAQAGNGVVIITTKSGAANGGKAEISYSSKINIQSICRKAKLFDIISMISASLPMIMPIISREPVSRMGLRVIATRME